MFEPILEDKPLSYAFERPQFYRNEAREKSWGSPVYFAPASTSINEYGTAGYHYKYGCTYNKSNGMNGNCTFWCISRLHELSGYELKECIGDAQYFYQKYKGSKDGNGYIGDKVKAGDILVFKDGDYGHVIFVEKVEGNTIYISESAYSKKDIYEDKACITYTLNKSDMICGNKVTLRPKVPFSEILVGVIHTSEKLATEKVNITLQKRLEKLEDKLKRIGDIVNE